METLLDFSKPHVLRNETEYNAAVSEVDQLLDADPATGSEAYERLEFLSVLIQSYEDRDMPLEAVPSPQDMVDFMLDQRGMSRMELADLMGGKSRVSEFFNGHRRLSLRQIKRLREHLGIPADLLIATAAETGNGNTTT